MKNYTLITVLGWEDRFIKGLELTLGKFSVYKIILICFEDYLDMDNMKDNIEKVKHLSIEKNIGLEYIKLKYNESIHNWNILEEYFKKKDNNYLLNITTIPRETIWTLFFFIKKHAESINYIYFKPTSYCKDWLTKNHKNPRLLFKHSGIFDLNKELVLFVIAGFDNSRLNQIIEFYEPSKIVVFYQKGRQFGNGNRNKDFSTYMKVHDKYCEIIEIDTYNVRETSEIIYNKYIEYIDLYNVIIDSQGPKISALSVYEAYMKSENKIALAYVSAKDFNSNYSQGIDLECIKGEFYL
ncbi:hypothetical protein [Flavobacterium sp. DSP2-3-1]|uniref:hypothetical protein n=1 Tax=Flavobacterium sp. DSP2-3-1 TaxID=2804620 RepID=UPI003CE76F63